MDKFMPKLLQINITANWGSTGKIAESIGLAAIEHGWESYIAYGRWCNPSQSHLIKIGSRLDTYLHYGEQRIRDNEGLCSRRATRKLIDQIKKINPDIIHLHNLHDHYLNYRILFEFLNKTNIKVVWTFHDFWAVTGHCMHFVTVGCERYKSGCYECPMQKVYPKSFFERSSKNYAIKKDLFSANTELTIVPVSEWVGESVRYSFLKNKKIQVIPNGIDTKIFKPTELTVLSDSRYNAFLNGVKDKYVIMSVASEWKQDKGLNDFIAMSQMLGSDEVIVLVGLNDGVIANLPNNIIGLKRTSSMEELAALYTRADVICSLSSAETFGLTIVEGYACGTPAVVYDNTAPPLLIRDETGFVVENKNFKQAYLAIQSIKSNGKSYYHDACIKLANDHFDKDKCFEKYIELYNELLRSNGE